jgi:hypothetical protein
MSVSYVMMMREGNILGHNKLGRVNGFDRQPRMGMAVSAVSGFCSLHLVG